MSQAIFKVARNAVPSSLPLPLPPWAMVNFYVGVARVCPNGRLFRLLAPSARRMSPECHSPIG
eukprot:638184-Alexandrium_andersonii.AAC.1